MVAAISFATLGMLAGPSMAQPASSDATPGEDFPLPFALPPPADTGKPRFFVPPPVVPPPAGCAAALDCRLRVLGVIQHNGAVELNATMLKW
jgi:hypothetical protein